MAPHKENVQRTVASLQKLASLESETLTAEINLLGVLRDRISPAAKYGDHIPVKYRRLHYKSESESDQISHLTEGFPFTESGKAITALLVIDNYETVDLEEGASERRGQYIGERLYLTHDRKWIIAERSGAFSEATGSANEWEAACRIVSDRTLLEKYQLDVIAEGLFAATDRLWEKLSPRMDALKRRYDKVGQVSGQLARLKTSPGAGVAAKSSRPEPSASDKLSPVFGKAEE